MFRAGGEQGQKPVAGKNLGCSRRAAHSGVRVGGVWARRWQRPAVWGRRTLYLWNRDKPFPAGGWKGGGASAPCPCPVTVRLWNLFMPGPQLPRVGAARSREPSWSLLSSLAVSVPSRGLCPGMRGQTMVGKSPAALGLRPGGQPPNACRALLLSFIHTFTLEESPCQHLLQAPLCRQTTAVV